MIRGFIATLLAPGAAADDTVPVLPTYPIEGADRDSNSASRCCAGLRQAMGHGR